MSRIRSRDTKPELTIRRGLHALGFRYVLHDKKLPGKPDIYLPKWNAAIYVHGCMWHGHGCSLYREPKTNVEFWQTKITGNIERDHRKLEELLARGVRVCTVWECALKGKTRLPIQNSIERIANWIKSENFRLIVVGLEIDSQDL
jgi:DNA mismatch endonuclease (patch repair protein)